jgi:hypothetical protein
MKVERRHCEHMVPHILGVKCGIHGNNLVLTKLEYGLELCRCLDPFGEGDLNPIHFTCVVKIKYH